MTIYNVASDHSGKGDMACINRVCELLENAGHTANALSVDSNSEGALTSRHGVGVFIVNGLCLGTVKSCSDDLPSGGKIIFAVPKALYTGSVSLPDGLKTQPLQLDSRQGWPASYNELNGKTFAEMCGMCDNIEYVYGETCDDIAQAILDGNFGDGNGGSGDSTGSQKEGSIMSGWESITDLLKPLDGEAMVIVRGDIVIIRRINPPDSTRLWIYEGINVVDDSVTVHDYSPEIYNTFVISWGAEYENQMEVSFTKHKELFGERKTEVRASYSVPVDEAPQMTSSGALVGESEETEETEESDGGGIWDSIMGAFGLGGSDGGASSVSPEDMAKNLVGGDTSSVGDEESQTAEVPITDEADAYLFGLAQVGKARRKSGHQIECKVIGSKYWEVGEWCKVYLPTFDENSIMFISKVNHESSADGEWLTSLTLVDYPPSLGTGESNTPSQDEGTEQTEQGILNSTPNDGAEEDSENNDDQSNTENGENN